MCGARGIQETQEPLEAGMTFWGRGKGFAVKNLDILRLQSTWNGSTYLKMFLVCETKEEAGNVG